MKLLNEIIDCATDPHSSVANTLRKCLILSFELKNEKLKAWVEGELGGFSEDIETIPDYRKVSLGSRGHFNGPMGAGVKNVPLPMMVIEDKHLKFLDPRFLTEPIASYERLITNTDPDQNPRINWQADM